MEAETLSLIHQLLRFDLEQISSAEKGRQPEAKFHNDQIFAFEIFVREIQPYLRSWGDHNYANWVGEAPNEEDDIDELHNESHSPGSLGHMSQQNSKGSPCFEFCDD
ncbi:hypothetical protein PISL3812_09448 [Talaromyces islandicus]|uniref:Uncharacterized protein n=1 Tax=Talaromyces islandicus TaxID=28573 RepID=A0A0U1MA23_TALIS|nr:hypothetical protein PISL3812_09448 [Talaromyces islandicus]